jgi:hypothetical protein
MALGWQWHQFAMAIATKSQSHPSFHVPPHPKQNTVPIGEHSKLKAQSSSILQGTSASATMRSNRSYGTPETALRCFPFASTTTIDGNPLTLN